MKHLERVKEVFNTFKNKDEVYQTSDGEVFFRYQDAVNYARTFKDNSVEKFTREEIIAAIADPVIPPAETDPSMNEPLESEIPPAETDPAMNEPLGGKSSKGKRSKGKVKN